MIDTTIRFNDHNSYKITSILMSYPFGVQNMTHITHSFQAYATTALASATRARTKFLDADGATLSEVSHSFAVTTVFGKVEITVAVPATATQAQLVLLQGGTDWWVAETKTEQGEVATPYNVNYQGQVSHLTPNGLYTGMVTANQIVVTGSIAQPDETLETRLVTINNNAINLSATVGGLSSTVNNHESRVTTIEAGQITLSSRVGAVEPKVTKITSAGVYTGEIVASQITAGYISADRISAKSITGAKLADGTISDVKITSGLSATKITTGTLSADRIAAKSLTGAKLADGTVTNIKIATGISAAKVTTGKLQSTSGNTYFDLDNSKILQQATVAGKAVQVEMSTAKPFRLSIYGNTRYQDYIYITDSSGYSGANKLVTSKYDINEDGKVDEKDLQIVFKYILRQNISPGIAWPNGYPSFNRMDVNDDGRVNSSDLNQIWLNSDVTDRITTVGGEQCGVDSTGFWMSSNWGDTKSYKFYF